MKGFNKNLEKEIITRFLATNKRLPKKKEIDDIKKKMLKNLKKKTAGDMLKDDLKEELQFIKFAYRGKNSTIKRPRVKLLDPEYPGQKGQKSYGKRNNDLLGWSISHVKNKRYAKRAVDEISDFARLLSANSQEAYKRIKAFYPAQAAFLRRYIFNYVSGLKEKKKGLWKKIDYNQLIKFKS